MEWFSDSTAWHDSSLFVVIWLEDRPSLVFKGPFPHPKVSHIWHVSQIYSWGFYTKQLLRFLSQVFLQVFYLSLILTSWGSTFDLNGSFPKFNWVVLLSIKLAQDKIGAYLYQLSLKPRSPEKVSYGSKRGHFEEPGIIMFQNDKLSY